MSDDDILYIWEEFDYVADKIYKSYEDGIISYDEYLNLCDEFYSSYFAYHE